MIALLFLELLRRSLEMPITQRRLGALLGLATVGAGLFQYELIPILGLTTTIVLARCRRDALGWYLTVSALAVVTLVGVTWATIGVPISAKYRVLPGPRARRSGSDRHQTVQWGPGTGPASLRLSGHGDSDEMVSTAAGSGRRGHPSFDDRRSGDRSVVHPGTRLSPCRRARPVGARLHPPHLRAVSPGSDGAERSGMLVAKAVGPCAGGRHVVLRDRRTAATPLAAWTRIRADRPVAPHRDSSRREPGAVRNLLDDR